jgi:hypothetical protein
MKKVLLVGIAMMLIFVSSSYADWLDFDRHGTRIFYGVNDMTTIGPDPSETDKYSWGSVSYLLEKDIYKWLSIQTTLGVGYLESDIQSTPSIEGRILLKAHYSIFHISIGGGPAYLFETDDIPDLADSPIYGIISGEAGIHFIEEEKFDVRAGYAVEHLSSPLHQGKKGDNQDPGWNVGGIVIQATWRF